MKAASVILTTTFLVVVTFATALTTQQQQQQLSAIKVPTADTIRQSLLTNEEPYLREAGINMKDAVVPPLGFLCKSSHKMVGPCDVSFKVCPKLHHVIHLRYESKACASGICASSGEHSSADDAAKESLYKLMLEHPTCACGGTNTTIGSCTFDINSCFQLNSDCTVPTFFASTLCTKNSISADFCCSPNATIAVEGAFTALAAKMNLSTCL